MELFKEILMGILAKEEIHVTFPDMQFSAAESVEMESLKALQKIKAVIEDDSLSDFECVEKIVRIFEEISSNGGGRHDFG